MKNSIFTAIAILLSLSLFSQKIDFDASVLKEAWQAEGFNVPESVYYDESNDVVFVSNINGKPTDMDHNGFISKIEPNGDIIKLEWVKGDLSAPKGMGVYDGKLYVTDIDAIVEIDIEKGEILNRYTVEGAKFMNDIAIDRNGTVYASDMQTNKIHKLKNGSISTWMDNERLKGTNGLMINDGKLIVGCQDLISVNLDDKSMQVLVDNLDDGIDGITMDDAGNIFFSHWKGNVFVYKKSGEVKEILSTAKKEIQSADIGINSKENLLYVPTFFDNRVVAYHINLTE